MWGPQRQVSFGGRMACILKSQERSRFRKTGRGEEMDPSIWQRSKFGVSGEKKKTRH
jgi:hypothetical protein